MKNSERLATRARTKLSPDSEQAFLAWYRRHAKKLKLDPNPDAPGHRYDYRGAYKAGAVPTRESGWHWPSEFKDDDHPNRFINQEGRRYDTKNAKYAEEEKPE